MQKDIWLVTTDCAFGTTHDAIQKPSKSCRKARRLFSETRQKLRRPKRKAMTTDATPFSYEEKWGFIGEIRGHLHSLLYL